MAERACRCEATVDPALLEGYACGRPDCWRTPVVEASFQSFATELVRKRGGEDHAPGDAPDYD